MGQTNGLYFVLLRFSSYFFLNYFPVMFELYIIINFCVSSCPLFSFVPVSISRRVAFADPFLTGKAIGTVTDKNIQNKF
ncbi:hypothetical protein GLYMA_02G231400v4 [Glycine max]|uniref:Uncharacterized protein n=2 Tax=Glycine subgen. Soja TaxID=1462606 RepID=K7KA96_SOYBN|nr:hypothetical protein JHK87_004995 [Glycine soja]KAG5064149.1 hypothetical protein JHK85_005332 [Glycine max]KAG5081097.1 hypothetical protein JHK86_005162 [Glycine max]KAH1061705.1 hypothetical protein GYH30_004945 [Glycine max]KRH72751.1 hypothetical protein GLYMA_02G231400v4 [Glycine max]